jgi:hypothetical protein
VQPQEPGRAVAHEALARLERRAALVARRRGRETERDARRFGERASGALRRIVRRHAAALGQRLDPRPEAAREPGVLGAQHEVADDRGRGVAGVRERLREQRSARVERLQQIAHAVLVRIETREDARHRRRGLRARALGVREEETLRGEAIEVRGRRPRVPVAAEVIRAQRVDRDQEHVRPRLAAIRAREREAAERENADAKDPHQRLRTKAGSR